MTSKPGLKRWRRGLAVALVAAALAVGGLTASSVGDQAASLPVASPSLRSVPVKTVVSLTFDDAFADHKLAAQLMNDHGVKGTFFVPSGYLGAPGYLTEEEVEAIAAAGHEIGGHTVSHPDLTSVSADEAKRQICQDRLQLSAWGFAVRSFAYPFAAVNDNVRAAAEACGYSSARGLGGLDLARCGSCQNAESLPPADAYVTKAPPQVESDWSLADLKAVVRRAERTGGWAQLTFHHVCESGCEMAVTPTDLKRLLTWLQSRRAAGTVVRTVGDAVGGPVLPAVPGPMAPPLEPGKNGIVNGGYEEPGAADAPRCWMRGGYGDNTALLDTTDAARSGSVAGRVTVSGYQDGDAKWLPSFDLGECSPSVAPGRQYSLRSWYTSTVPTQFTVYLRDAGGRWHYWTSSPWFAASGAFSQAVWTTPQVPADVTAMSFGLNLFSDGTLVTDDVEIYDSFGAPSPTGRAAGSAAAAPGLSTQVEPHATPEESR